MLAFVIILCSDVLNVVCDTWNYGFPSILANVEISEMGLYEVSKLLIELCIVVQDRRV